MKPRHPAESKPKPCRNQTPNLPKPNPKTPSRSQTQTLPKLPQNSPCRNQPQTLPESHRTPPPEPTPNPAGTAPQHRTGASPKSRRNSPKTPPPRTRRQAPPPAPQAGPQRGGGEAAARAPPAIETWEVLERRHGDRRAAIERAQSWRKKGRAPTETIERSGEAGGACAQRRLAAAILWGVRAVRAGMCAAFWGETSRFWAKELPGLRVELS